MGFFPRKRRGRGRATEKDIIKERRVHFFVFKKLVLVNHTDQEVCRVTDSWFQKNVPCGVRCYVIALIHKTVQVPFPQGSLHPRSILVELQIASAGIPRGLEAVRTAVLRRRPLAKLKGPLPCAFPARARARTPLSVPGALWRALITSLPQRSRASAGFSPLPSAPWVLPSPADNGISDQSALLLRQDPDQFIDSVRVAATVIVTRRMESGNVST